jgi:hypothetical protein
MSHPYQPGQSQPQETQYGQPAAQQYAAQGQPPYGPPPGSEYQYGGQQPPVSRKGSGLAISALVLAIIAVLLCWVPIVNNFAAVLAVVGLALGIPALVSARRGKRSGSGLALASVILSVLALIGVFATQAFYVSVLDDVADEISSSTSDEPAPSDPAENGQPDAAAALPLGQSGELSEYTVTVDSVTTNGNAIVEGANQFNSPPTGQYVLVDVTVTFNGSDDGDPWLDLTTEFVGSDARKYDASSCSAVTPNAVSDVPTLLSGGTASFQLCMDVPPTAVDGGQVKVSESFSFDDVSATWAIQ